MLAGIALAAWLAPRIMGRAMSRMMAQMMGSRSGRMKFSPMEMCEKMLSGITDAAELASLATPEVRALFEDWAREQEGAVLAFIRQRGTTDPDEIATHLRFSKPSAVFFVSKLAREGKLRINRVEAVVGEGTRVVQAS